MGLRFIIGRSGMGKTYRCFQEIKNYIEENSVENLILLVPEQFTLQMERDFIENTNSKGIMNLDVLSFKRLAYKVFSEVGGISKVYLNDTAKDMVLRKAINDVKGKLTVYKKAINSMGFTKKIAGLLSDFKKYNISSGKLEDILIKSGDNKFFKEKLNDINLIYNEFEKYFRDKYVNRDEDLTVLSKRIGDSEYLENAVIWIDSFDSFTPQEYEVIEALLRKVNDINITLTIDADGYNHEIHDDELFSITKKTRDNIIKLCKNHNIKLKDSVVLISEITKSVNRYKNSLELAQVEENLFAYPYGIYEKETDNIKLFASNNRYDEIRRVAMEMTRLSRDREYKWNDMAVICGDIEIYQNIIEAIFTEYNIPYFIDKKRLVEQHVLIKFIESALEILAKGWDYESVFKYLRTEFSGVAIEDVDRLENYVLAYGIRGNKWLELEPWKLINPKFGEDLSEEEIEFENTINEIRNIVREPLVILKDALRSSEDITHMVKALYEFLVKAKAYERIEILTQMAGEQGNQQAQRENAQVWDIVIGLFDQMVEILGDENATIEEFYRMIKSGFEGTEMGIIPASMSQVLVGNLQRSRSHDIKALFLIGTNEGLFPTPVEDIGFITDNDKEFINAIGYEFIPDTKSKVFEDQFLIYSVVTRPSEFLHISYAMADGDGKALRPSMYISKLKSIFPKVEVKTDAVYTENAEENLEKISIEAPTFKYLVQTLRGYVDTRKIVPLWKDVYKYYYEKDKEGRLIKITEALFYTNIEKNLSKEVVDRLYGNSIMASVSKLEAFSQCPFSYFVKYGLKAKERKEFKLGGPDLGKFFHEIIEAFSERVKLEKKDWSSVTYDECKKMIDETVEKLANEKGNRIFLSSNKYKYILNRINRIALRTAWVLVQHVQKGEFKPKEFEVDFSEQKEGLHPIKISLKDGKSMRLTGRIDRIDTLEYSDRKYIKIIDYKSGNMQFDLSNIYNGLNLQLVVYMDELLERMNGDVFTLPAGMFYFHIDDPIILTNHKGDAQEEILKEFKMSGLVIGDKEIANKMDESLDAGVSSDIVPVGLKKDGDFTANSSVATKKDFDALRKYVKDKIVKLGEEILDGNIEIAPYKRGNNSTSCSYCDYNGICQFDKLLKNNSYRKFRKVDKKEFWEAVCSKTLEQD